MADAVTVKATIAHTNYITTITSNEFTIPLDEPISIGGSGTAPAPFEYLYASLAGCVAVTLRMYTDRKGWDVGEIVVTVNSNKNELGETLIIKQITFEKELTEEQKNRLKSVSEKCPVSKLLSNGVAMETKV